MKVKNARWATLVGGGFTCQETYRAAQRLAPAIFAADGGANHLRRWGERPEAILGDFDSLQDEDYWASRNDVNLIKFADQDTTDFEKSLDAIEAELILAVGFLGGRMDHELAAIHALLARPERRVILLGGEDVAFLAPRLWRARLTPGDRVSIWPARPVVGLRSEGLRWPLKNLHLEAGVRIGTSNQADAPEVLVEFDRPGAVILLPAARLQAAVESLMASPFP